MTVVAWAVAGAGMDEHDAYDSKLLDFWLRRWPELCARAEHMRSPCAYDVARPAPTRGRFSHGEALEIMADIERAHAHLPRAGQAWLVIDYRKRGHTLGAIARALRIRKDDLCGAYRSALDRMTEYLNC